jgi:hypothetical protein
LIVALAPLSAHRLFTGNDSAQSQNLGILSVSSPWTQLNDPQPRWRTGITSTPWSGAIYQRGRQSVQIEFAHYVPRPGTSQADEMVRALSAYSVLLGQPQDRVLTIDQRSFPLTEVVITSAQSSAVVWTWYSVSGSFAASRYVAKIELARSRLLRTGQPPLVIAVTTDARPGDDADALLRDLVAHMSIRGVTGSATSERPLPNKS